MFQTCQQFTSQRGHNAAQLRRVTDCWHRGSRVTARTGRWRYSPRPAPLRVAVVEQNFECHRDGSGPLVFLNACKTGRLGHQLVGIGGFANAFVKGGAGAFVSSLWSVGDGPSADFAVAFYKSLLRGDTAAEAATAGRTAAREAGDPTWLAYTVYAHPAARLEMIPSTDAMPEPK